MQLALFRRFLRFGALAFGGPIAQIGMIKRELVDEERWIEPERFGRVLGVYQALPGPEAHELCVHFGMLKGGRLGGFLAGLGFMLPGFVLMLIASIGYVAASGSGASTWLAAASAGAAPAVVVIVARGAFRIGKGALTAPALFAGAVIAAVIDALGGPFWTGLLIAAIMAEAAALERRRPGRLLTLSAIAAATFAFAVVVILLAEAPPSARIVCVLARDCADATAPIGLLALFWIGLKGGLLTFGGAYTAIPFVRGLAVGEQGFMTDETFLDGLAIGGLLPAPLVIFSTFVGYIGGGIPGALATTAGMFLPAFAFTLLGFDLIHRIVEEPRVHALLDGVTAGVVGIVAVTVVRLGIVAAAGWEAWAIAAVALLLLLRWRSAFAPPLAIVLGGAVGLALLR